MYNVTKVDPRFGAKTSRGMKMKKYHEMYVGLGLSWGTGLGCEHKEKREAQKNMLLAGPRMAHVHYFKHFRALRACVPWHAHKYCQYPSINYLLHVNRTEMCIKCTNK